jgi:cytochrome P450
MLYRLATQPELASRLRAEPDLVPQAVEEFLRFDSPVQGLFRTNAEGCPLGDHELPSGTKVQLLFAAANRDPRVWDDPDTIRLDRFAEGRRSHLAFGWGVHHCIGNALARHEAQFALRRMLDTFATIEIVGPVRVNEPFILRGLTTLPVRWTVHSSASGSNS